MKHDPARHHRRSIRLRGYDYSQAGAFFVTVCTRDRTLFFDDPFLRAAAEACWRDLPAHLPYVELDEWVVMPNHVHAILVLTGHPGRGVQLNAPTRRHESNATGEVHASTLNTPLRNDEPNARGETNAPTTVSHMGAISPARRSLAVALRTYKAAVTTSARALGRADFAWQRGYHEHILRNARELDAVRQYIAYNPLHWAEDGDNPANAPRSRERSLGELMDEVRRSSMGEAQT